MKIEKMSNGTYRIRQMYKGKRYCITLDYKPTQKEALILMGEKMNQNTPSRFDTGSYGDFKSVCGKFIDSKEKDGLSPSTIRSYWTMLKYISDEFKSINLYDITQEDIQKELGNYERGKTPKRSPKSVKNMHGLIHSVLDEYRPDFIYKVKLPTIEKKSKYEPTTEDVMRILDWEKTNHSKYEIAIRLATLGVRRGEIIALTLNDLDKHNVLTINKDIVLDKNEKYVLKNKPKTEESNRRILLPSYLADLIRDKETFYEGDPHEINVHLQSVQKKLGIPKFNLHYLRHFAAAYLHKEGFTDEQIMAMMGWSQVSTMAQVYRYNLDPHDSQKEMANAFDKLN